MKMGMYLCIKGFCILILVLCKIEYSSAIERELTVNIDPGKDDCFYQEVKEGQVIDLEYQVIDGGHGDLDITFRLVDPNGRIIVADFKKSENNHRTDAKLNGDYRFCFDNTFSTFNTKTVFFEFIIEGDSDGEWDNQNEIDGLRPEDVYSLKVQDVQDIVSNVRNRLTKVRFIQEAIKSSEARDRNVLEENFFKVNSLSILQIVLMIGVGLIQVVMVKSLFDDSSKVHKIWKNLDTR